jgi:metal-sulfur cluster biosynthetic enzyme
MQTHELDQRADLGLGTAQQDRPTVGAQAPSQNGDVEHQWGVGEDQLGQIDDDVGLGTNRSRQSGSTDGLRVAIFIATAAERGRLVIEVDDRSTLVKAAGRCHANLASLRWGFPTVRQTWGITDNSAKRPTLQLMATVDEVTDVLRDVIDPELGLDFVELGLIYDVEVQDGTVRVTYTLTSPGCPIGPQVSEQIEEFVSELDGVEQVEPTMTFSPPWTPERMSEDAKFALGF